MIALEFVVALAIVPELVAWLLEQLTNAAGYAGDHGLEIAAAAVVVTAAWYARELGAALRVASVYVRIAALVAAVLLLAVIGAVASGLVEPNGGALEQFLRFLGDLFNL